MRKLLAIVALVALPAIADTIIKNAGTRVGPILSLDCTADGGIGCARSGSTGGLVCNPASATEKGCVTIGTQTMAGAKTFSGGATFSSSVHVDGGFTLAQPLPIAQGGTAGSVVPGDGGIAVGWGGAYSFLASPNDAGHWLSSGAPAPSWSSMRIWATSVDFAFSATDAGTCEDSWQATSPPVLFSTETSACFVGGLPATNDEFFVCAMTDNGKAKVRRCNNSMGNVAAAKADAGYRIVVFY